MYILYKKGVTAFMKKENDNKITDEPTDILSIFDSIEDMQESKNIMYYYLFTDFNLECEKNNFEDFNNALTIKIMETHSHLKFTIPYNLFGIISKDYTMNQNIDYHQDTTDRHYVNYAFLKDIKFYIPLEHCIITSLHTARYLLCKKNYFKPTSAYRFINSLPIKSTTKLYTPGFHVIKFCETHEKNFMNVIKDFNEDNSSDLGSRMKKMIENEKLPYFAEKIFSNKNNSKQCLFTHHNADLYLQLIHYKNILKTILTKGLSSYKIVPERFEDIIQKYMKLGTANIVELSDEISANDLGSLNEAALTDQLILQYQLERYFNVSLINKLLSIANTVDYKFSNLLIRFSMIPDIFNRNIYVDWAIDNFKSKNIYSNYKDTPRDVDKNLVQKLGYEIDITTYKNDITTSTKWGEIVSYGIDYLSRIYYPYYEKYYFIHLYDYIKQSLAKERNSSINTDDILYKMEEFLFNYCKKIALDKLKILNLNTMPLYNNENFTEDTKKFYIDLLKNLIINSNFENLFLRKFTREYFGMLPPQDNQNIINHLGAIAHNCTEKLIIENFIK